MAHCIHKNNSRLMGKYSEKLGSSPTCKGHQTLCEPLTLGGDFWTLITGVYPLLPASVLGTSSFRTDGGCFKLLARRTVGLGGAGRAGRTSARRSFSCRLLSDPVLLRVPSCTRIAFSSPSPSSSAESPSIEMIRPTRGPVACCLVSSVFTETGQKQ